MFAVTFKSERVKGPIIVKCLSDGNDFEQIPGVSMAGGSRGSIERDITFEDC